MIPFQSRTKILERMTPEQRAAFDEALLRAVESNNPFVSAVGAMAVSALVPEFKLTETAPELFAALLHEQRFLLLLGSKILEGVLEVAGDQAILLEELRAKFHGWAKNKAPMPDELIQEADKIASMIDKANARPSPAKEVLALIGSPSVGRPSRESLVAAQKRFEVEHGIAKSAPKPFLEVPTDDDDLDNETL